MLIGRLIDVLVMHYGGRLRSSTYSGRLPLLLAPSADTFGPILLALSGSAVDMICITTAPTKKRVYETDISRDRRIRPQLGVVLLLS